jgi:hypothetical protein
MLLSTSNSNRSRPILAGHALTHTDRWAIGTWTVLLLVMCVGWVILVEVVTVVGFDIVSKIQRRIHEEYTAALAPNIRDSDVKSEILLVGNSLLNAGVDFPQFAADMPSNWRVKRLVIESTTYIDWYYGLRRLFRDGARPDIVCLMLSWQQLATSEIRGEYFAHYLMQTRDFFPVVRDLGLHPTPATSLFVGHLSAFYGARVDIRKFILSSLLPDLPQLTALMTLPRKPLPNKNLREIATMRLRALKAALGMYGTRVVFILAPTAGSAHVRELEEAGRDAGVPVVIGSSAGELAPGDFSDGFHLNPQGAHRYTHRLAIKLRQVLDVF